MGAHVPRQATDPCKVRVRGSIPLVSTLLGGVIQLAEMSGLDPEDAGSSPVTPTTWDE
jgi:hypothetical protein